MHSFKSGSSQRTPPTRRHSGTGGGEHTHEEDGDDVNDKDVENVDGKGKVNGQ